MPKVMIVDDEPAILTLLEYQVSKLGYAVVTAASGEEALQVYATDRPDAVLLDINLPGIDGIQVLERLKAADARLPVLMMTAAYLGGRGVADGMNSVQKAVQALTRGAYDYLLKPSDKFADKLRLSLQNALRERDEMAQAQVTSRPTEQVEARFANIIGESLAMREVFGMTEKVLATDATVLILGESGTGKELIAKAIHYNSPRREKDLVVLNCAAITESLLESELFGHEKGSFTGAAARKAGKFEAADGGTIFLDEIGDMPLTTQAKVLRVLQEGEVVRVGGNERLQVDVRCLAATHRDLERMVAAGEFREDLYYRLNVYPVTLPPLRDRVGDVPLLAAHFAVRHSKQMGKTITSIDDAAVEALCGYRWPGNVRELENTVLRAVILAEGEAITLAELPPRITGQPEPVPTLAEIEAKAISQALQAVGGDWDAAATRLGVDVAELRRRAAAAGLER